MKRHTSHDHRLPGGLTALRQSDVQHSRGFFCVFKKQLVKVSHAVEKQRIGKVCFKTQVLGHHGGVR